MDRHFLQHIVHHKRRELQEKERRFPLSELKKLLLSRRFPVRSLRHPLLVHPRFHFICEIKKASPSKGLIRPRLYPAEQALAYIDGGASAISVLTDHRFFQGELYDLSSVRRLSPVPVVRKDFILSEYQVYESRLAGADVILLIAAVLTPKQVDRLAAIAGELGMEVLLEIHQPEEIEHIPDTRSHIILGINNRNLRTFRVAVHHSLRIKPRLPPELPVISESGIQTIDICRRLKRAGFRGALIGEFLMREPDPRRLLRHFLQEVNHAYPA